MGSLSTCTLVKVPITDFEVPRVRHNYKETSDDKAAWNRLMNAISESISSGEMTRSFLLERYSLLVKHHTMWQVFWKI